MPATVLTASVAPPPLAELRMARALAAGLGQDRTAPVRALHDPFDALAGRTLDFASQDGGLMGAVLVPETGTAAGYGLSLKQALTDGPVRVDIGVKLARDRGALGLGAAEGGLPSSDLVALAFGVSGETAGGGFFALSGEAGYADLGAPAYLTGVSAAQFTSLDLDLGRRAVFAAGDRLTLGLSMPMAVSSGRAEMVLPVARAAGGTAFEPVALDLAPAARELDLAISYQRPLAPGLEILAEIAHATNHGNRAGRADTGGLLALTFTF